MSLSCWRKGRKGYLDSRAIFERFVVLHRVLDSFWVFVSVHGIFNALSGKLSLRKILLIVVIRERICSRIRGLRANRQLGNVITVTVNRGRYLDPYCMITFFRGSLITIHWIYVIWNFGCTSRSWVNINHQGQNNGRVEGYTWKLARIYFYAFCRDIMISCLVLRVWET